MKPFNCYLSIICRADDLKHHWQHFIRRDDETRRYTREEELALKAHFDKQRGEPRRINQCGFDWEEEAAALNSKSSTKTRRIAFEVFQQYQKRCNTHHRKFNWSKVTGHNLQFSLFRLISLFLFVL